MTMFMDEDRELNSVMEYFERYKKLGLMEQPGRSLAGKVFNMYRSHNMLPEEIKGLSLSEQLKKFNLTEDDIKEVSIDV